MATYYQGSFWLSEILISGKRLKSIVEIWFVENDSSVDSIDAGCRWSATWEVSAADCAVIEQLLWFGHRTRGGCCERPQAGGEDGHDAGGHRAAPCQGLGQGARSTLGKGTLIVISCLMMAWFRHRIPFFRQVYINLLRNVSTRWIGSYSDYVRSNREMVGAERVFSFYQLQLKKLSLPWASISSSLATDILTGAVQEKLSRQSEQNSFFRILDYLLGLHRGLSSATFPDEFARDRSARWDGSENLWFLLMVFG